MEQPATTRVSPGAAALGATQSIPDEHLPLLASVWLTEGWDSDLLVELAGMSPAEARGEGRRLLPPVLASLGFDPSDEYMASALGRYAAHVAWAVKVMDGPFTSFSASQKLVEMTDDEPGVFDGLPGLDQLAWQVAAYEQADAAGRQAAGHVLREQLLDLAERLGAAG